MLMRAAPLPRQQRSGSCRGTPEDAGGAVFAALRCGVFRHGARRDALSYAAPSPADARAAADAATPSRR